VKQPKQPAFQSGLNLAHLEDVARGLCSHLYRAQLVAQHVHHALHAACVQAWGREGWNHRNALPQSRQHKAGQIKPVKHLRPGPPVLPASTAELPHLDSILSVKGDDSRVQLCLPTTGLGGTRRRTHPPCWAARA